MKEVKIYEFNSENNGLELIGSHTLDNLVGVEDLSDSLRCTFADGTIGYVPYKIDVVDEKTAEVKKGVVNEDIRIIMDYMNEVILEQEIVNIPDDAEVEQSVEEIKEEDNNSTELTTVGSNELVPVTEVETTTKEQSSKFKNVVRAAIVAGTIVLGGILVGSCAKGCAKGKPVAGDGNVRPTQSASVTPGSDNQGNNDNPNNDKDNEDKNNETKPEITPTTVEEIVQKEEITEEDLVKLSQDFKKALESANIDNITSSDALKFVTIANIQRINPDVLQTICNDLIFDAQDAMVTYGRIVSTVLPNNSECLVEAFGIESDKKYVKDVIDFYSNTKAEIREIYDEIQLEKANGSGDAEKIASLEDKLSEIVKNIESGAEERTKANTVGLGADATVRIVDEYEILSGAAYNVQGIAPENVDRSNLGVLTRSKEIVDLLANRPSNFVGQIQNIINGCQAKENQNVKSK